MLGMCGSSIKGVVRDQSGSTPGSTGAVCPSSFLPFATFTIVVFYIRINVIFYSCVILLVSDTTAGRYITVARSQS